MHLRRFGHGPREVLALHCTIAHAGAWRGLAREMEAEATFHGFDLLSHGRSPDWDRRGDIQDRTVEAAERLLRPGMDVVGHSFGATVALRLAVTHPQLIRSVTLFEPVFFAVAARDAPDLLADHDRAVAPVFEALERGDDAQAARVFNRMWGTEDSPRWPELPESTRAAMTRSIHVIPAADEMLYRDRAGLLRPGVLDRATMPVLLVRGSLTHPVIGAINDGLARRLPEARNVVIPGAGHMVPITHPAQSAVHLRALFAETA
ncbi:MAG TPA: alpha/beta hydrolase [Rhodobacteraceae bacterium]|nr:alpha/beta hydrolase [Paracoccaceae bacterium]